MQFGHKPSFASSIQFLVATVKILAKNCIGCNGQKLKNRDFRKFRKSAPWKIENLVEISVFFNEMVIRPTNKVQETHL